MSVTAATEALSVRGGTAPRFAGQAVWEVLARPGQWLGYLSVIVPMGLFNVIGSLQNIESAEAAGDRYSTGSSLAVNGVGTIAGALLGSCFPTTIYIGHPGWKELGARAGYSTLNGLVIAVICLTGTVGLRQPNRSVGSGDRDRAVDRHHHHGPGVPDDTAKHAPAVAIGLFPAIAAWGATVTQGAFQTIGLGLADAPTMQTILTANPAAEVNGFLIHGMITMERGYIFTCMLLAAISAWLIDRKFYTAAVWSLAAACAAALGLTHAYQLAGNSVDYLFVFSQADRDALTFRPWGIVAGYLMFAALFAACGLLSRTNGREASTQSLQRRNDEIVA